MGEVPPTPDLLLEEREREFKWLRETVPTQELTEEMDRLREELAIAYAGEVQARLTSGEYELVSNVQEGVAEVELTETRPDVVEFFGTVEGRVVRVTLPEGRYPDAYVNHRQQRWLADLVEERRKTR